MTLLKFQEVFRHVRVKNDGRCLYRAIAKAMYEDEGRYEEIRRTMYDWSVLNLTPGSHHPLALMWNDHIRKELIRQLHAAQAPNGPEDWSTTEHLWIAEYACNIRTYCWCPLSPAESSPYTVCSMPFPDGSHDSPTKVIHLLFNGRNHFDVLRPRER